MIKVSVNMTLHEMIETMIARMHDWTIIVTKFLQETTTLCNETQWFEYLIQIHKNDNFWKQKSWRESSVKTRLKLR